jgi:hypothetical protein
MWQLGRQGSGYFKRLILSSSFPVPFDIYILKYPNGSHIDWHTDPVLNYKHYRLNIFLRQPSQGGQFSCEQKPILSNKYFQFFRPDINKHKVDKIIGSTRYVLSIGFLIKDSK